MNKRQLNILSYLLEQQDYVTARTISQQFKVTPKTIYLDLNILQKELEDFRVSIDKKTNRGIRLLGADQDLLHAKLQFIKNHAEDFEDQNYDIENRRIRLFLDLVLLGQSVSLQKTSENYFVSKSSILNDLDYLRKNYLAKFHIDIVTDSRKKMKVIGSEENIQFAAIDAFVNTMFKNDWVQSALWFDPAIYRSICDLLSDKNEFETNGLADHYKHAIRFALLVLTTRIKNGFHIQKEEYFFLEDLNFMESYPVAEQIAKDLERKLDIEFTQADRTALSKYLALYRASSSGTDQKEYEKSVEQIIERLEKAENIPIKNKSELMEQLLLHIPPMILRLKNGIKIENPLLNDIKTRYLHLFNLSWYILSLLEDQYQIVLTEDEISFVVIYFQMAITKSSNSHKILVVCPYGIASSKYALMRLRNILPRHDNVQACGYEDLKNKNLENLDLIVSTSTQKVETSIPVVHVSPILDSTDCAKIFDAYARYIFIKTSNIKEVFKTKGIAIPILHKNLEKDKLFLKLHFDTKEEILDFMIQKLEAENAVKPGFRKSVYKREKIGSTLLENGVAIPHGMPTEVNKTSIVAVTLENPVKWSSHWADLIILLAVPESNINEFESMIIELYSLISNTEIIKTIKNVVHVDELL
ncbi:BglG family transcription antiterminator [Dubosiella newyorkensis]|uniref:BglG family transcription antiterminator n=1 Tax=Dubosiella newyorkensis TaxID=1862672 RepID=UPI00248CD253|nr:BglG family transcription antiterminator [Dubosiella newyorkensis]